MESKLAIDRKTLGTRILKTISENKSLGFNGPGCLWYAFKSLSKDLGDDFIDYLDFEHFYWKLEKGECDVDYDGRPEYNRNLCDLPLDIIGLISEKLTTDEKFVFRESSSSLRNIINPYLPGFEKLKISLNGGRSIYFLGNGYDTRFRIEYSERRSEETGELEVSRSFVDWVFDRLVHRKLQNGGRTVEESMIEDIRQILDTPKTRLVDVHISSRIHDDSFFDQLKPLLESQENIRKVVIYSEQFSQFITMLSSLKPKTLEEIELKSPEKNLDLSGMVEMDQLKQAKRVELKCSNATYPLNSLMQLEDFWGSRNRLDPEEILAIKEESTRTGKMKNFAVGPHNEMSLPRINELLGPLNPEFNDSKKRRHFRIQNSEEFMKMEIFDDDGVKFSRVPKIVNQIPINFIDEFD